MNFTKPYWGIIFLSLIGGVFLLALAYIYKDSPALTGLLTLASVLLSALASVSLSMIGPPPDPAVPSSVVREFLYFLSGRDPGPVRGERRHDVPTNVLFFSALAAVIVIVLALILKGKVPPAVILTAAGLVVGLIAPAMKTLATPDPGPTVPASSVHDFMEVYAEARPKALEARA